MQFSEDIDFVIIGAQKSGTTSMHEVMKMHPQIAMPTSKEAPVFNDPMLTPEHIRDRLKPLFPGAGNSKLKGKATPQYMPSRTAREALYAINPQVKIIAILRDPVERSFSHFRMVNRRNGDEGDFDSDITALLKADHLEKARTTPHDNRSDEADYIVAWSEYGRMLEPYFETFGKDNILVLYMADLERDGVALYARVFEFLGVDSSWTCPEMTKAFHKGGDKKLINTNLIKNIPLVGSVVKFVFHLLPETLRFKITTRNIRPDSKSARDLHKSATAALDQHFQADQARIRALTAEQSRT